jgi:hypothetical protein
MATGDSADILNRVRKLIPRRWFAFGATIRDAVLGGLSDSAAWCYSWITFARQQSRIATSSGIFLDIIGWDFFGGRFVRRNGESDSSWRPRILQEILRPRQTRAAIVLMLQQLTGRTPVIYEAWNTGDMGSYGTGTMGYGMGDGLGSLLFPNQIFLTAYRTPNQGVPLVSGYGMDGGGYGVGLFGYIDTSLIIGQITDAEIYARIEQTIAAGITAWTDLLSGPAPSAARLVPKFSVPANDLLLPII